MKLFYYSAVCCIILSCSSSKPPPYSCGPVMDQKSVRQTFQPIIDYMELKPGDVFADVGASSGSFTVMMATLLERNSIYIQDIDTTCLNEREFTKVIDYYSTQSRKALRQLHTFHLTIGAAHQTNLPDNTIDKIYTNATFHHFSDPDAMIQDLYRKLKPGGALVIRDSFTDKTDVKYCEDSKSPMPLVRTDVFLQIMARNKFVVKKSQVFSGYPVYFFTKRG